MDVSLDYINKVIARNNASKQAGTQAAPAVFGIYKGFEGDAPTVARMRENQRVQAIENAQERQRAYQAQLEQHKKDMQQINQREALERAAQSGNKDLQYRSVQEYLSGSEKARTLWDLEHGGNTNQNAAAQRKKDAEAVRASMSGAELSAYDAAMKVYGQYGGLYNAGRMVGDLVAGSLKNAAGNVMTTGQSAAKDYKNRAEALQEVYQQERSVNPLKAFAEVNRSYGQELDKTKEEVLDESSTGLQLAREGSEQLQRGAAGLNGGGKVAYDLASSMIANAPSMALALIPGVGPAASLGTLGAQAAGGKIDELSARGIENREALKRGVVSGVIESATEVLPVSNWVDIIKNGGKKAAINIAKQALGEATEEGASYVLNYIADKAFQDPEAEFSLQDLAASAAMGAASGGIYGAVGTGINRIGNKVASSTQQNGEKVAQVNQANKPADVLAVAQEDDMLNQLNTGGQAARNAAQAQQNTANAARAREAVDGTVQAENPLNQLFPGRKADQNAAQAQQNAVSAARAQEAVEGAVQAENPLNQLFPGGQAAQNAAQAQQNAVNDAQVQEAMAGNVQAETQLNQLFPGGQIAQNAADVQKNTMNAAQAQQEEVQQSAMRVRQWAEENESFTPEMRTLAEENYQPGGNTALYTTAIQNFYDAGRSGALSYEQAMELNQNRAAVLQQDSVLRRAWELGQKAANPVYDTPGGGRVEGQVQYESGTETNTVLDDTVLQAAAHKLGVNIKVVQELTDDAGGKANGRWAAAMSEIALGENSSNAYQTLAHEMTHYMGSYNPEGWQRLRSSALEWYAQQGGQRTGEDMARYEAAYGDYAKGADEAARDILSGVMSTEGGVRSFLAYLSTESGYTVQEQKTILQTLREMLDTLLEKVRGLLRGGDATVTAAQARQMAERADQLEARRALINDYLYELDNARQNAEQEGLQLSAKENAPAASRSEAEYSINPEFDREIREWDAEGRNESKIFTLGTTSEALQSIGVRDRSIVMLSGKIRKILRDHPGMTMDMIRQIPAMLEHPALVLESQGASILPGTKQNSRIVVVGTVTDAQGNPVLCALDLAPSSRQDMELGLQDFNKVSSAYAKDVNPKGFLEKSNVLYASPDKKITQAVLSSFSFKLASSELNHLGSIGRITYQGGKVNIQGVPFRQVFGEVGSSMHENEQAEPSSSKTRTFQEGNVRYSRKGTAAQSLEMEERHRRASETENRRLARENSRMADQIELLKQETRLSGGHLVDVASVDELARRIVKRADSRYDADQLSRELRRVYESMSRGKVSGVQEAMETLTDLARGVLSQQRNGENQAREVYQPLLEKVRAEDWTVREGSPLYQDLLDMYGDGPNGKTWGNVRKALFGRIDIKKSSESGASGRIDALFEELAGDWPGIFDPEAAPADNIQRLMEVYDEVRDGAAYDLETGMSEEEQAAYLAQDLYDAYLSMPRRQTFADKSAAQAEALTRRYRQEKTKELAQQKAGYEQKLQEQRKWARDRMAELEQRYKEARQTHDQELIIKTHNQIAEARRQANDSLLRRRAALEWQWSNKKERADVTQQRQRVQKSVQALHRWLMKPTAQHHVQTRMQGAVLNLLNSLDMKVGREGSGTAARWQEVMKDIQLMAKDALAADSGMADTDVYADFDPDLPAMIGELIQGNETLDVSRMNSRQLKQLADVLTSMQTSIRNANKMMSDAQGRTVDAIAEESAREMAAQTKNLLKNRYMWAGKVAQTRLGDAAGQLLGLDMMDARRYFTSLGTTAQEKIYGPIRKGFDKRVWLLDSAQKAFEEIKGDTDIRNWTGDRAPVEEIKLHDGRTIRMTVGQRMELYNLSQRQQAHEHLMQGGFTLVDSRGEKTGRRVSITAEDLAKITGSLTSEQVRMAQRMSDYLSAKDGPAGWGNEVSQKLYGLDKFTERHYWPIKSDSNQTRTSDATDGGTAGFWAIKNQGFTKNLQRNANNSVLVGDAFDTWANHVANMATYNAWSIPLSDAMKWFNWKSGTDVSTKEQIEGIYGRKGKSYFTTLLQDINGMSASPSSTGLDKLTREVTRNWKVAKVSANLRVAIQQPTAYIRAGAVMDPKYLAQALAADVTKLRHGMQMAEEHCAIAKWKSWGYFETNIGQSMRNVLTGQQSTMEKVREVGTKLAEMGDKVTWGTLWNACEAEARAKGLEAGTEQFNNYCADRLSEIVDKTQVVDSVLHRSHIMRSKNPLAQMSTNFFAEPTKSYSMMAEAWTDMMHGKEGAKKNFARATATYVLAALGTAAAASLIDAMRVSQDEDRDKEYGERYLQSLWENFGSGVNLLNNIPLVKDVLSIADGYDATRSDMEMFSELLEAFDAIQKARSGNITPYRLTYQVATALSSATGLPMSSAVREAKSAYDMLTDLQDPLQIDRKMNREEDDYSYIDLYNQVKATGGNKDEFKALYQGETYGDMLGTARAEAVDTWLQALARNSGKDGEENTAVLPKQLGNELTYTDAQSVEHKVVMKGPEYVEYAKSVQQSTVNLIDEYMKNAGKTASTDEQTYFVKLAKEYAQETARATLIPGYEAKDWVSTVQALSGGKNVGSMILARQIVSRTDGEKDSEGKTISGSKAANAVQRLQKELGYSAGEAQALYNNLSGATDNTYMKLYQDVEGDKRQVDQLAALFGTGEAASYAGMLQKSSAGKVDAWLQELSGSQGKEVLPDRVQPSFKAGDEEVELDGKQYIEYANSRTQTAYNILNELVPYVGNYSEEEQAGFVTNVETYATQVAKAEVSGFEPYQWVKDVQAQAGDDSQALFMYIMAKELIYSAEGQKDANGKTISGTKKAAALRSLQEAGYSADMAQQMYKLFN